MLSFRGSLAVILGLTISQVVSGSDLTIHESRVLNSVPLTQENFERAKNIDLSKVERKYPIGLGGPQGVKYFTDGVEGPQTQVKIVVLAEMFPVPKN